MTYTFRKASSRDIGALLQLRADFMDCFGPLDDKGREALGNYREFLSEGLPDGTFVQWLAETGNEIAATGSISFYRLPPTARRPNGRAAYIGNMFTYPPHRNQGLAGEILRLLADEARAAGCHAILLHASEQGRPLYRAFGFEAAESMMEYKF
ncbi:MAG: GNAT family N-acetyltransferase [Firmicutes bacterium]|nr:GNAT family N-acetyltransferase [Bacillota bacterium]